MGFFTKYDKKIVPSTDEYITHQIVINVKVTILITRKKDDGSGVGLEDDDDTDSDGTGEFHSDTDSEPEFESNDDLPYEMLSVRQRNGEIVILRKYYGLKTTCRYYHDGSWYENMNHFFV